MNIIISVIVSLGYSANRHPFDYYAKYKPYVCGFSNGLNVRRICHALKIATIAHGTQSRKSGEAFIVHPVETAKIVSDMNMDENSIISALLHDTIEDTNVSIDYIRRCFGDDVATVVNGVTKKSIDDSANTAELLIAMNTDIRVVVVKLADRLHNMRTLEHMSERKRQAIAKETADIFIPIAHAMGFWSVKNEMGDIALKHLHRNEYDIITSYVGRRQYLYDNIYKKLHDGINALILTDATCAEHVGAFDISSRCKSAFSIHSKMIKRNYKNIDEVLDIFALRIVVDTRDANYLCCYHILALIHSKWASIPGSVKDYVSMPKANMYQSLHTTIVIDNIPVEIQIRTPEMHENAEFGAAAHVNYKHNFNSHFIQKLLNSGRSPLKEKIRTYGERLPFHQRRRTHCLPLPGDEIVAEHGVVHEKKCIFRIEQSISHHTLEDVVDNSHKFCTARIFVRVQDRLGILVDVSKVVSKYTKNIIDVRSQTNVDYASFVYHVEVNSKQELDYVMEKIKDIKSVELVQRNRLSHRKGCTTDKP